MKLDILAFGAHPDDIELSCGGTLIRQKKLGYKTGIVDLTRGELGTRGSKEQRAAEAQHASEILNLDVRENLGFADGFFLNDAEHQLGVIKMIRKYRPEIIFANATYDRHPDHPRAAALLEESFFKAGLKNIVTYDESGTMQQAWRPKKLYHYIQSVYQEPDFLVDISNEMDQKMEAIRAYKTQFFDPNSAEPDTYISSPLFMQMLEARATDLGHRMQVRFAEGFKSKQILGIGNVFDLL